MKQIKQTELEQKIAALWALDLDADIRDGGVEVQWYGPNRVEVTVSQMYAFVPANYSHMKALEEIFGTDNINLNSWSSDGCGTCDWGSQYAQVFTILNPTKEQP